MEYCEKGSLLTWNSTTSTFHALWSKFELTENILQHIFRQITFALFYLHNQLIVHNDLKPQNILLTERFCVKIIDFDQAVSLSLVTEVTKHPGTYQFFPPERISSINYNSSLLYKAVDIWDLGLILYAGIYGALPFNGENVNELFLNITEK